MALTGAPARSIRAQLQILVLAAVLPLLLASAFDIYQEAQKGFDRAHDEARRLARVAAADSQHYFERAEQRLGDIARRIETGSLEPSRCHELFSDIETIRREYAGIAILDQGGRLVCIAAGPNAEAVDGLTAARPLLALAGAHPRLLVGAPLKERTSGSWVLPLAYPVRGGAGRAAGMVIAAAQFERFHSLVARLELPEQPVTVIMNGEGLIISHLPDPDRHIGQSRRGDPAGQAIIEQRSGVVRAASAADGVERIYGFEPVQGTDWIAIVGIDVARIKQKVMTSALQHAAYAAGVLVLALLLSYYLSRRIAAPIHAVASAAHAFGEGRRDIRVPAAGAKEVAEVAVQLNGMLDALAERERGLEEAQAMLNSVLGSMDRALWSFAPDMGVLFFASDSTKKIFGHEAAEFRTKPGLWLELVHPDDRAQAEAVMDHILASGMGVMEYRIIRPGGEVRWIEARWRHVADGQGRQARLDGIVSDITEIKQAEEENRQLLAIVEQSLNEIYVFDAATLRYEYANSGALHNLGCDFHGLMRMTPLDLMPDYTEGAFSRLVQQLLQQEKPKQVFETRHRRTDGSEYPVEVHLQAVVREGRWKCLAVVIDISERQRAQKEILRLAASLEHRVAERTAELARANAELESFAYSISHDLRTPLRAINGYASILIQEERAHLGPESVDMLERIARGAVRMGVLIDDLLNFSKVGRIGLNRTQVDMEAMVRTVAEELREDNPLARVQVHPMPAVMADPALLRQALLNLVGNALKFTARCTAPLVEVGVAREEGQPVFFVRDNGVGFEMEHATKLFGVFHRLHREADFPGTGVGLAIVKRIIERHGGRIWAEAVPGKGATFFFTLA
ncbi:MAG: hypothetical protein C0522_02880 [Rhodocyclaceae bacterium]|jgi:PAS domain S-box-containing protein|nr:hypothetical protein [Rhodocyclaceae bacterium]